MVYEEDEGKSEDKNRKSPVKIEFKIAGVPRRIGTENASSHEGKDFTADEFNNVVKPVRKVLDEDLKSLRKMDQEERILLWNEIGISWNRFSEWTDMPPEMRKMWRGRFKLAQLMVAASFYYNEETENEEIIKRFNEEEYKTLYDVEDFRIFTEINTEMLKKLVEQKEGGIIEIIDKYEKQYKNLESLLSYPNIEKDVAIGIMERYSDVNEKIKGTLTELVKDEKILKILNEFRIKKGKDEILLKDKEDEDRRKKDEEQRMSIEKEQRKKEAIERGAITGEGARNAEIKYIEKFDAKMKEFEDKGTVIINPLDGKKYDIRLGELNHLRFSDKERIVSEFQDKVVEGKLPINSRSRYVIEKKHIFSGKKEAKIVIEAMVLSHWKKYGTEDYDTEPAALGELNAVLAECIDEAEKGKYFHILGVASPTGWGKDALNSIYSDQFNQNYVSRYVSVCLIDLGTGRVVYNKNDAEVKRYVNLFTTELDREGVEIVKKAVKKKFFTDLVRSVTLREMMRGTGQSSIIVRRAFYHLEDEDAGKVLVEGSETMLRNIHEIEKR